MPGRGRRCCARVPAATAAFAPPRGVERVRNVRPEQLLVESFPAVIPMGLFDSEPGIARLCAWSGCAPLPNPAARAVTDVPRYCAREFSDAELALIRTLIAEHDPPLNRGARSRVVCERLDWRKPDGGLKDMSARVACRENLPPIGGVEYSCHTGKTPLLTMS